MLKWWIFAGESEVYSVKRLKQKLQDHYKGFAFFSEIDGRSNVLCFKNLVDFIINEQWQSEKKANADDEAERIVLAAAKIISAEIRGKKYNIQSYPTIEDISNTAQSKEWIPHYLQTFLKPIISSQLKQTSIGHAIVQASCRSVITPTLFGLGVELDHTFGSRWLVDELSRLGFSITYDEFNRYKQSVIQSESLDNILMEYFPGTFTQWVADNVDHNIATLDGRDTFHGMGIIAVSTPSNGNKIIANSHVITRLKRVKVNELVTNRGVPIVQYFSPIEKGLSSVTYKPIVQLQVPYTLPPELCSNLLWHSGWLFCNATKPRPNWSGFMQHIFSDNELPHSKSEVLFLPIIDLNSSDETCTYSTLLFIQKQAEKLNIPTPCITFDQPLWLKASEIIKAKSINIVCRLGGFHTVMSFIGSIGFMMKGSGLEEALSTVYGTNAVNHITSGKAVSRAVRGHFLVEAALVNKLISEVVPVSHDETGSDLSEDQNTSQDEVRNGAAIEATELTEICSLFHNIQDKSIPVSSVSNSKELVKLEECLQKYKSVLADKSLTAKLWLQYIYYIEVLKLFIWAERTADWNLHLVALGKMLNLFAATGHFNYAKCCRLYLQEMHELPTDHPWLYQCFNQHGLHAVRRSCRYWAGLWTDLVIEQVMMRSIKSRGGLTRGRGMTESVCLQWVCSLHKCAAVHEAMTSTTNLKHNTSDQHIELSTSRCKCDFEDLFTVQEWFDQHEPFNVNEGRLRSLSSGLTATNSDNVNCHLIEEIGSRIQLQLDNMTITEAKLKRRDQVRTLDHLYPGILVDKKKLNINPNILFTRLIAIVQREESIHPFFEYELTSIPTSLFKDNIMRRTDKSQLGRALKETIQPCERMGQQGMFVLDGGSLLHKIKWPKKATYKQIAMQYVQYVQSKYGNAIVVFDGYGHGPSIKDHEHQRRIKKMSAEIQLQESMECRVNQQIFLANENKSQFIQLLSQYLKANYHVVKQSRDDADHMIVECALQLATEGKDVSVVAEDTDILVLLMYHWKVNMADIYFQSEARKSQNKGFHIWNIQDLVTTAEMAVISNLLFIHAWSGCDTTCATFGHGKLALLKKIKESEELQEISKTMCDLKATAEEVGQAGIQEFILLYGGKRTDSLNHLRYTKCMETIASSKSSLDPQKFPPTERAAYFHSLRVHLQVALWKELGTNDWNPEQWGWKLVGTVLVPVMTDLPPAPETLLKFIRCRCKLSSKNPCGSTTCTCRKNGLKYVTACGDCRGESCMNTENIISYSEEPLNETTNSEF